MPGPGRVCSGTPVSRTIYVRKPTTLYNISINESDSTHFTFDTELIATTESDENGFYEVNLQPGTYSVLVEDEGKEYCNSFGIGRKICQVIVEDAVKEYNIRIDHAVW